MTSGRSVQKESEILRGRVQEKFLEEVDQTHRSLLRAWIAFGITFGLTRLLTHAIHKQWIPNVNLATDEIHIHHYVWGIALLMLVGFLALVDDKARFHKPLSIAYGIGAALIVDEFALLLNLRDVYWAEEGRWSVDIALAIITVTGVYVTARRFWHAAAREVGAFSRRLFR